MFLSEIKKHKRCCYRLCKSDTRSQSFVENYYYFINFPKPCQNYRNKMIKSLKNKHIPNCPRCNKCALWVKKCNREKGFKSIDDVTEDTFICSLHFEGESGPSQKYPHPLSPDEILMRTKASTDSESTYHLENSTIEKPTNEDISIAKDAQISTTTKINKETQTTLSDHHKSTQIKMFQNFIMENFENSLRIDNDKCIYYTSFTFKQLEALYEFLSPASGSVEFSSISEQMKAIGDVCFTNTKLTRFQELLIVLIKLRLGSFQKELAYQFEISTGLLSQIWTNWIYFLYNEFSSKLKPFMFQKQEADVDTATLTTFDPMKNIRVIIDCAEFFYQSPHYLEAYKKHENFRDHYHYASTNKVLIGCTPKGVISFVSDIFETSVSNTDVFKLSKITHLLEPGDLIVADKTFFVHDDIVSKAAYLNTPPFLEGIRDEELSLEELNLKQNIIQHQIVTKRAINKMKYFQIFQTVIPQYVSTNTLRIRKSEIVFICACLVNFQKYLVG